MNNYTYIVSSLPVIVRDRVSADDIRTDAVIEEIRSQLSASDCAVLDFTLGGFDPDNLCEDFYRKAAASPVRFVREYFGFDLNLRNAKTRYLNTSLGKPSAQDTIVLDGNEDGEFEEEKEVDAILNGKDILARERGIDDLYWQKIEDITTFDYFDLDVILGFVARLKIVDRWLRLDEEAGREYFRSLVSQVRSTFKGVEYSE